MTDFTGRLDIELACRDGRVQAAVRSSRPTPAGLVFAGRSVEQTAVGLPALFSICAAAQASACASACEAALGLVPAPLVVRLRRLLVDAETLKEHLWRMLLDWPRFLEEPPSERRLEQGMAGVMAAYLRLRSLFARRQNPLRPDGRPESGAVAFDRRSASDCLEALEQATRELVLGDRPSLWLERIRTPADLLAWAEGGETPAARLLRQVESLGWAAVGRSSVRALPELPAADLERLLSGADADRFVAEPLWLGEPKESSPYTRRRRQDLVASLKEDYGNSLLTRLAAHLVELATLHLDLRRGLDDDGAPGEDAPGAPAAVSTGPGVGIAQVPAARGLLIHRVAVDADLVSDYRILAPTEWNFHPRGAVTQGLKDLPLADIRTLGRQASLFVTVVDPCVEYHVKVS